MFFFHSVFAATQTAVIESNSHTVKECSNRTAEVILPSYRPPQGLLWVSGAPAGAASCSCRKFLTSNVPFPSTSLYA